MQASRKGIVNVRYQSEQAQPNLNIARFRSVACQLLPATGCPTAVALEESLQHLLADFREHLAVRFGHGGYGVMFDRALLLTMDTYPAFGTVEARPDGSLNGLAENFGQLPFESARDGTVALVTNLLSAVADFVGHELTYQLVNRMWPEIGTREEKAPRVA
jgi:hypothetical protein